MASRPKEDPPSFRDAVTRPTIPLAEHTALKGGSSYRGEPALLFSETEYQALAAPFDMTLVGQFASDRPNMEFLRKGFQIIGFNGAVSLGLLDSRHILIRFASHEDYYRCWIRGSWSFKKHVMKVLKWTPDFTVDHEPPVAPVWISLTHLPIHLFQKGPLLSLASLVGRPLRVDSATKSLSRPSVARVCVEVNLSRPLPKRVWIGAGESGFWQTVTYEDLPNYCTVCSRFGHEKGRCAQPDATSRRPTISRHTQQAWRPIDTAPVAGGSGLLPSEKSQIPVDASTVHLTTVPVVQQSGLVLSPPNPAPSVENTVAPVIPVDASPVPPPENIPLETFPRPEVCNPDNHAISSPDKPSPELQDNTSPEGPDMSCPEILEPKFGMPGQLMSGHSCPEGPTSCPEYHVRWEIHEQEGRQPKSGMHV